MCQSSWQLWTCRAALPSRSFQPKSLDTFLLQAKSPRWGEMWEQMAALDDSRAAESLAPAQLWGRVAEAELMGRWQTLAYCRGWACWAVSGQKPQMETRLRTTAFKESCNGEEKLHNCACKTDAFQPYSTGICVWVTGPVFSPSGITFPGLFVTQFRAYHL